MSRYTFVLSKPVLAELDKAREKVSKQVGASLSWDAFLSITAKRLAEKPPRLAWKPAANGAATECAVGVSQETHAALAAIKDRECKRLGKKLKWDSFLSFVAKTQEKA